MQDLFGWNRNGGDGQVWFQIGEDEDVNEAVILVVDLGAGNSTDGYSLYLDGALETATLWNASQTGVKFLAWDGIPRGTHTYKLVKNSSTPGTPGTVIQWGSFTMDY